MRLSEQQAGKRSSDFKIVGGQNSVVGVSIIPLLLFCQMIDYN